MSSTRRGQTSPRPSSLSSSPKSTRPKRRA
ncbi:hypothetical protein IEO21_00189 [Rhodonia placenta]|uniref:Uncharacterized protein n=1 Tax=Rhodonia placenta TaxID=104341 RepID=A0A8H7U7T4_9APHY|nr:hypothetical protein IEO21_00189 [Postia placenta]